MTYFQCGGYAVVLMCRARWTRPHNFSLPLIIMFRDFDWMVSESWFFLAEEAVLFETFPNTAEAAYLDHAGFQSQQVCAGY